MNDKVTISTAELFRLFTDVESARKYLESRLWPEGPKCPVCGLGERITARKGGYYRCNQCKEDFTVRTGTIFERSHVKLHLWLYSMYLLVTARKGISSLQLSKEIGVTQKTAWFILHRLRDACGDDLAQLSGIIEGMRERETGRTIAAQAGTRRRPGSGRDGGETRLYGHGYTGPPGPIPPGAHGRGAAVSAPVEVEHCVPAETCAGCHR